MSTHITLGAAPPPEGLHVRHRNGLAGLAWQLGSARGDASAPALDGVVVRRRGVGADVPWASPPASSPRYAARAS